MQGVSVASLVAQMAKNLPAMWEYQVDDLGWEVIFLAIALSIISTFIKTTCKVGSIFLILVSHLKAVVSRKSKQMTPCMKIRVLNFFT